MGMGMLPALAAARSAIGSVPPRGLVLSLPLKATLAPAPGLAPRLPPATILPPATVTPALGLALGLLPRVKLLPALGLALGLLLSATLPPAQRSTASPCSGCMSCLPLAACWGIAACGSSADCVPCLPSASCRHITASHGPACAATSAPAAGVLLAGNCILAARRPGLAAATTLALLAGLGPLQSGLAVPRFRLSGLSALSLPSITVLPLAPPATAVLAHGPGPKPPAVRLELAPAAASPACASGYACLGRS